MEEKIVATWSESELRETIPAGVWAAVMWSILVYGFYGAFVESGSPESVIVLGTGIGGVVAFRVVVLLATLMIEVRGSRG